MKIKSWCNAKRHFSAHASCTQKQLWGRARAAWGEEKFGRDELKLKRRVIGTFKNDTGFHFTLQ
jgi:hypothetical protein